MGLPPTRTKGAGESTSVTTFELYFPNNTISRSGVVGTVGTLAVAGGGTGVTASSGASSVMLRDANQNTTINSIDQGITTTATVASATTTLTAASTAQQYFTGNNTQTVALPNATTLNVGRTFIILISGAGILNVTDTGGNLVQQIIGGPSYAMITVTDVSTANGTWNSNYIPHQSASGTAPNTLVTRTSNSVIQGSYFVPNITITATAAGTTTLTASSSGTHVLTGTSTQTLQMPVVTTLTVGTVFVVHNRSSGIVTVTSSGTNTIKAMDAGSTLVLTLTSASADTTATPWDVCYQIDGILPISRGGTGQTTKAAAFDALSPMSNAGDIIYGGASGTGTALSAGNSGEVLVSAGTSAPAWTRSAIPTVAGPSTLQKFTVINEDWITGGIAGEYGWTATTATGTVVVNTASVSATEWGLVALTSGTTSTNAALISLNAAAKMLFGTATAYVEMKINLSALSVPATSNYTFRAGLMDNWTGLPNNGIWFDYNTATSPNWVYSTANGGSRTQTTSSTAVATGWLKLGILITTTSAQFFVNGTSIGTAQTSNFPTTVAVWPGIGITKGSTGSANTTVLIDYYSLYANWSGGR